MYQAWATAAENMLLDISQPELSQVQRRQHQGRGLPIRYKARRLRPPTKEAFTGAARRRQTNWWRSLAARVRQTVATTQHHTQQPEQAKPASQQQHQANLATIEHLLDQLEQHQDSNQSQTDQAHDNITMLAVRALCAQTHLPFRTDLLELFGSESWTLRGKGR